MTEAETERAAVVAWLRRMIVEVCEDEFLDEAEEGASAEMLICNLALLAGYARMIERGEHLTNEGK